MLDLNTYPLPRLFEALIADGSFDRLLHAAIEEDVRPPGDITTDSIVEPERAASAMIATRCSGVLAGMEAVRRIVTRDLDAQITVMMNDGEEIAPGEALAEIRGNLRSLLGFERIMLNLLGRLSGIATLTRMYVDEVRGTGAVMCDTRKTTPGLRTLEKYAVRCGGGMLHRIGLFDAALYKDNHLAGIPVELLTSRLSDAIRSVRSSHEVKFVEVEVDTLAQLRAVLGMERGLVDMVLLDNMSLEQMREAVAMRATHAPTVLLECSGGVTLERVRDIAQTGVDRISAGALTHSATWLDVGLDIR